MLDVGHCASVRVWTRIFCAFIKITWELGRISHMLRICYKGVIHARRICYSALSGKLRHVVYTQVPKKCLCMQKFCLFFPPSAYGDTATYTYCVRSSTSTNLKRVSDIYPTALCNEASFRLGKNFTSSDIRTWEHVI